MAEKKYSKELQNEICKHIASGLNYKDAAYLAGIVESTLYRWLDPEDKTNPLTPEECREFSEAIKKAGIKDKQRRLKRITKHAKTYWQADAWMLECKYPDEFAKKEQAGSSDPQLPQPQTEREAEISAILLKKYYDLKRKDATSDIPLT